jgi:hypothetical protein
MAKLLALIIGLLMTAAGVAVIWWRWKEIVIVFWGLFGLVLLIAGLLVLVIGVSEVASSKKSK